MKDNYIRAQNYVLIITILSILFVLLFEIDIRKAMSVQRSPFKVINRSNQKLSIIIVLPKKEFRDTIQPNSTLITSMVFTEYKIPCIVKIACKKHNLATIELNNNLIHRCYPYLVIIPHERCWQNESKK